MRGGRAASLQHATGVSLEFPHGRGQAIVEVCVAQGRL